MPRSGDQHAMSVDVKPERQLSFNSRALVVSPHSSSLVSPHSSSFTHVGDGSVPEVSINATQNGSCHLDAWLIENHSKKLQDDVHEMGQRIKHHELNIKYLKTFKNELENSISEMQVALSKLKEASFSTGENGHPSPVKNEEETIQHILKHENSAAALLCQIKSQAEALAVDHSFSKDVVGIVATLGKVDDENLSRLLSEYLGLETMLALVCKTYEGVQALEAYNKDGSVNRSFGLHPFAAATGKPLVDRFSVICLEIIRPYAGELIADDPQRSFDLLKPRLLTGETPPGFLGFAVNMITIDDADLYYISKNGHSLRETLFYHLFSNLQVYTSRADMINALSYITDGAISLDGGIIRGPGKFSLGYHQGDMDVKFAKGSKRVNLPERYFEIETQIKEMKWKKDRTAEDMQREQVLLNHVRLNYETKKQMYLQFIAESSSLTFQHKLGREPTPR